MTFQIKRKTPSLCQKCPDVRRRIRIKTNRVERTFLSPTGMERAKESLALETLDRMRKTKKGKGNLRDRERNHAGSEKLNRLAPTAIGQKDSSRDSKHGASDVVLQCDMRLATTYAQTQSAKMQSTCRFHRQNCAYCSAACPGHCCSFRSWASEARD